MSVLSPGALPAELVPGEPDEVERLAARLTRFAAGAGEAAVRLDALSRGAWSGEAGELFREAVGEVPASLTRAATAFASAARALTAYARTLREGQAAAARAVRLVERSTPESREADQQAASRLVARARTEVEEAGRAAAARLSQAAADAPEAGAAPTGRAIAAGVAVRVVVEHELTDPDGFLAPSGDWAGSVAELRFTDPHDVGFAGSGPADSGDSGDSGDSAGPEAWESWAAADTGRHLGVGRAGRARGARRHRRRPHRRSAGAAARTRRWTWSGLDEAELRRRREEFGGARHRDGMLAPARVGAAPHRRRLADASCVHSPSWRYGPSPDRSRCRSAVAHARATGERVGSVDRDVRGAVLRTGRPAHEGA